MRWVTAQELSKIAKKSQVATATVPERTIRHMALQQRIVTKKEGKIWLIDPASALRAGLYIAPEDLEALRLKKEAPPSVKPVEPAPQPESTKKYKRLGELGVYGELKSLYLSTIKDAEGPIKEAFKQTLYNLAIGFFEYPQINKAEYFKRARKCLVGAVVEDDLSQPNRSGWRDQIEDSIMPGIIGLIRRQEGKNGRGQSKAKGKD